MAVQFIGENLVARDDRGRYRCRIATVFPRERVIVTLPGIHATQRLAYVDSLNEQRCAGGLPPLSEAQIDAQCLCGVDLVLEDDIILIRPDPNDMALAFGADELLQELAPKEKIKFLHVRDEHVRQAIKQRGECWRINALPRSPQQMLRMIAASRIGIEGRAIYYYNNTTGTRFLTYEEFCGLALLPDAELRKHLREIRSHCLSTNRYGNSEIEFFAAGRSTLSKALASYDFEAMSDAEIHDACAALGRQFHDAVQGEFRRDDPQCPQWRSRMYAALIGQDDASVSEEALLGLSAEFYMQVEWLPGGRIEEGELIFDPIFEEGHVANGHEAQPLCDPQARGFIFNFVRDYGDIEYVNIGRVVGSLSSRNSSSGRRGVYLAEIKQRGLDTPILRIIRMQKWGVREHLNEGKDLLTSLLESEQYTEFILDRRLGCRQLGMNLPPRVTARNVGERYAGSNLRYNAMPIYSAYFERDYVAGLATDKVASSRLAEPDFSHELARLLGRAAAPNLIVGRANLNGNVIFDDGDELLIEGPGSLPIDIVVADPTGTFVDYLSNLSALVPQYANCINRRLSLLADPAAFIRTFLDAFIERFTQIQADYRKRKRAFDTLFSHQRRDEGGSFAFRWEKVLQRLAASDPLALAEGIRKSVKG